MVLLNGLLGFIREVWTMACIGPLYEPKQILGLQIAQSRSCLHTLGPKVATTYILGALGKSWFW